MPPQRIWLARHGETKWSLSGQHTGRTDIALTPHGEQQAALIGEALRGRSFALVLSSPLQRAWDTCQMAGFGDRVQPDPNLREWDYGEYEGVTTASIHNKNPWWDLWNDGVPGGETITQVAARALDVIDRAMHADGDVLLFSHGHLLRIVAAMWLGLPPQQGRLFALSTATISTLGFEHGKHVVVRWNVTPEDCLPPEKQ
ncbi:MAG: histidine phosphatase family protein [Bryobacterales bacterium]|nr:histidine phosphatase family protein [Bryobacterales bacterium]